MTRHLMALEGQSRSLLEDPGFGAPPDPGIPAAFVVWAVVVAVAGIAMTLWRVSLARQVAQDAGMDPDQATAVTLLSDDGLEAAYLAGNLRSGPGHQPAESPTTRPATERLRELQELRAAGLITAEEYETRRTAIVDSL